MKWLTILFLFTMVHQNESNVIFDSKNITSSNKWFVVDDGVMGGLSEGSLTLNNNENLEFKGYVTTENNGGFSSVRYAFDKKDVSNYKYVVIRLKGDGKSYQFRVKKDKRQRYTYINSFDTSGDWEVVKLKMSDFYPGFRGYQLDRPNFSGDMISEIGILIGNKKKEAFKLEIDKIYLE